ncbi:MAG: hypothetical protein PHO91_03090 [Patescibacteria group bacterium]|nr:hypothetical protein [Patescibacteria group bacterium]
MKNKGFSIIELLVAISFVSVIIILILAMGSFNSKILKMNEDRISAFFNASEAMEAMRVFDWNELNSGQYYPYLSGNSWQLAMGSELLAGRYSRWIDIEDVYRENYSNGHVYGQIVTSGGYLDPDTKKVSVIVNWPFAGAIEEERISTYLHRWRAERLSQEDWSGGAGQESGVYADRFFSSDWGIDVSFSGMVTLRSGFLNWNNGTTTAFYNLPGTASPTDIFQSGNKVYIVSSNNNAGPEFYIFDVSDIYNPILLGTREVGSTINAVKVKGDYAFLASASNSAEVLILNISNPYSITVVASYDLSGSDDALDIAVNESQLYVMRSNRLYSFDISNPASPIFLHDLAISTTARSIFLAGSYIYVASNASSREVQVFNVINPANMEAAGIYNLPGSIDARDIYVYGNRAYVSASANSDREFFVLDVSDPYNIMFLGSYERGVNVDNFTVVGPYALLAANSSSEELTVIDVSFPATINKAAGYDWEGYIRAMTANCSNIYALTSNTGREFVIFSTEETDCGYASAGVLESSTFDTGVDQVVYNWIAWSGVWPVGTQIRFQLASSSNNDGPWNFVGPDGTNSSYYTQSAQEFINYNHHLNQRYFRYKLFLESSSSLEVPLLEKVTISYSNQ